MTCSILIPEPLFEKTHKRLSRLAKQANITFIVPEGTTPVYRKTDQVLQGHATDHSDPLRLDCAGPIAQRKTTGQVELVSPAHVVTVYRVMTQAQRTAYIASLIAQALAGK